MESFYPIILLIASAFFSRGVHGTGTVHVKLESFINPSGKTAANQCCDRGILTCSSRCDQFFKVCLNDPAESSDANSCSVGEFTTEVIEDENDITFTDKIGKDPNPFEIKFKSWAPTVDLKVIIKDVDEALQDSQLVQEFNQQLKISPSTTEDYQEVVLQDRTSLFMKVSVSCDEHYYGSGCTIFCEPQENYDCGPDGEKICKEGEHCEVRTIPYACASNPCYGGATCKDDGASFSCACPVERKGKLCETWISHICDDKPCHNGGTCIRIGQAFHCLCRQGYFGVRCEWKIGQGAKHYRLRGAASSTSASMTLPLLLLPVLHMVQ